MPVDFGLYPAQGRRRYGHDCYLSPGHSRRSNPVFAAAELTPAGNAQQPSIAPAALLGDTTLWQPDFSATVQTSRWP